MRNPPGKRLSGAERANGPWGRPRGWQAAAIGIGILSLLTSSSCVRFYALTLSPEAAAHDAFPEIRRRAPLKLDGREESVSLSVHYAPGESELARRALREAERPLRFLREITGRSGSGSARFFLYPVPANEPPPSYSASGWGASFVEVFMVHEGRELLEVPHNRRWFYQSYPHEMSHGFLADLRLRDRWLSDGLAEYLTAELTRLEAPDIYRGLHWTTPPLVALARTPLEPWDHSDLDELERVARDDPAYGHFLAERMVWKYAAAEELIRRWMLSARERGIEAPVEDLLHRVERLGHAVEFEAVQELALAQTGRSLEELAEVTQAQVAESRQEAWSARAAPVPAERGRALTTLSYVGLPPEAQPEQLLPSFVLPAELENRERWGRSLVEAAGGALAVAQEPQLAERALGLVERHWGPTISRSLPAEFWRVLAHRNRDEAVSRLVEVVTSDRESLSRQKAADQALQEITGRSVHWQVDLGPRARQQRAYQWRAIADEARQEARPEVSAGNP